MERWEGTWPNKDIPGKLIHSAGGVHVPVTAWRTIFLCFEADGRHKYYFHCCCAFPLLSTIIGGILFSFPNVEANQEKWVLTRNECPTRIYITGV